MSVYRFTVRLFGYLSFLFLLGFLHSSGIIWNETNDNLVYNLKEICDFSKTLNAMFYNPIGLLQPIIVNLKTAFPKLEGFFFFDEVGGVELPWKMLMQDSLDPLELVELYKLNDASFRNNGACILVRCVSQSGENISFSGC